MEKIIYILWKPEGQTPAQTKDILLNDCAPKLIEAGALKLTMNIDDPDSDVKSSGLCHIGEPISAQVSIWLEQADERLPCEEILKSADFNLAGYLVDEFVFTDYGGNEHSGPRDWPDGERSPGLIAVNLLEKPKRMSHEKWTRHWFGTQGPVSEAMQPRQRYVRNEVIRPVTPGAHPYAGIVEEVWPSAKHITNPYLFFGADNIFQLIKNQAIMVWSVIRFLNIFKIRNVIMSEYLIKT